MDKVLGRVNYRILAVTQCVSIEKVTKHSRTCSAFEEFALGKNNGINSSFTVRKISYGEGVERVFQLCATGSRCNCYEAQSTSLNCVPRGRTGSTYC